MTKLASRAPQDSGSGTGDAGRAQLADLLLGFSSDREQLLPVLHEIQRTVGYVPPGFHAAIAEHFNLTRAEVHGVISYYHDFRDTPPGECVVKICRAEACQSMGAETLAKCAEQLTGCAFGQTSPDGRYTLESIYCLGLCASAPAVMVRETLHARVSPQGLETILNEAD